MFLNNFYNIMLMAMASVRYTSAQYGQLTDNPIINTAGKNNNGYWYGGYAQNYYNTNYIAQIALAATLRTISGSSSVLPMLVVAVGNGSNSVSADDYTLTNMIISNQQYSTNVFSVSEDGYITCSVLVTNTTDDDYVVSEVGLMVRGNFAYTASTRMTTNVLVYREVLEKSVTIPTAQSAVVTFKLRW